MNVLEYDNVTKDFATGFWRRRQPVLRGVSLVIPKGEVFGLLGHNGAGKTTAMRIALGLLRPTNGNVALFEGSVSGREARRRIGYLGDEIGLYPAFTAREMLRFCGELFGLDRRTLAVRVDGLLDRVGMARHAGSRIKGFSKGMRQRLGIALALINDPEFLMLDEPYIGLDPIGRREIKELLLELKREGKTILMSSHIVPDIEAVCDRIGFLSEGKIQKDLSLREFFDRKDAPIEVTVTNVDPRVFDGMQAHVAIVYHNQEALVLRCNGSPLVKEIISKTYAFGGDVAEIKRLRFGLEDYLFETLGADRRDASVAKPMEPTKSSEAKVSPRSRATKKPQKPKAEEEREYAHVR